ncbi:aminopeptidase P family protein [Pyxidicoccus parkwayensis]|uniref:Aminopeptidase P family protein n=1 Tax=Pyxidicoccus parkwayensis TaxID=2813578 RepID=A0ABX7PCX7_9BACT|nr:M24 family metallopeptidase [Pyxidicoccus parkwaysis]QSQ28354.1 aminopeptidase P family protein [Pyxidicoccus parkwaysis]
MTRGGLLALGLMLGLACRSGSNEQTPESRLLPWSRQIEVRESWLAQRHALLLPMMRNHGIGMWIVVNEEFHDDPLTQYVAPPRPYASSWDLFVFIDAGEQGLKKYALTLQSEEHVEEFFEAPPMRYGAGIALSELFNQYQPRTIGLSMNGKRGMTRSLTRAGHAFLVDAMGPEAEKRFVSAEPLITEYLDTRLPGEYEHYQNLVALTEKLARQVLSPEVIVPGRTTVKDVRRWLYDRVGALGLGMWFQPDVRVQRAGLVPDMDVGFIKAAKDETVLQRGDLVHLDFGISYMGLHSDLQRMAYLLREGEKDVPEGLKLALTNTHALQDALTLRASKPERPVSEVYEAAMAEMGAQAIQARIYCHPLGNHGHALGAAIDEGSARRSDPPRLRKGSYIAIELSTATAVPEWEGQKVQVMQEDPAWLSDEGWKYFVPRQEAFFLVP